MITQSLLFGTNLFAHQIRVSLRVTTCDCQWNAAEVSQVVKWVLIVDKTASNLGTNAELSSLTG